LGDWCNNPLRLQSTLMKDINNAPDTTIATKSKNQVYASWVDAWGRCSGHSAYYTMAKAYEGSSPFPVKSSESGHPYRC